MKSTLSFLNLTLFCTLLSIAYADPDPDADDFGAEEDMFAVYGDDEFLSIATGTSQPISKAPAVATIITEEDIELVGANRLDDILQMVPGLHVSYNPSTASPLYIFRGIHSEYNPQVLLLINGVPATNLFHGDRGLIWAGMPTKAISRIEIIRGPGSAIYGADAFAGVINVITKNAEDIKTPEYGIRAGSFQTTEGWLARQFEFAGVDLGVQLEIGSTDGHEEIIEFDAQSAFDLVLGTDASRAPGPANMAYDYLEFRLDMNYDAWKLRAGLQQRSNVGLRAGAALALDPSSSFQSNRVNVDVTYTKKQIFPETDLELQLSAYSTTQEVESNLHIYPENTNLGTGVIPEGMIGNPEVFERHGRFNFSLKSQKFEGHQLRFDWGYYYGDLYEVRETKNFRFDPTTGQLIFLPGPLDDVTDTPDVFLPERVRKNSFAFIQDTWTVLEDWALTAGVRYDDYSDFGDTVNPRFALVWSTTLELTTKLLYGSAFRAPSFAQLYAINNPVILGNDALEPEKMDSFELAFDYKVGSDYRLALNIFQYDWEDIILFVPQSDGFSQLAQNAGEQSGEGFEFEIQFNQWENHNINFSYAYQNSEDKVTNSEASFAPRQLAFLNVNSKLSENLKLNTQIDYVADRPREVIDTREAIEDYARVNLALHYHAQDSAWNYSARISNVFDEDHRIPARASLPTSPSLPFDFPLAGRSIMLEVTYTGQ